MVIICHGLLFSNLFKQITFQPENAKIGQLCTIFHAGQIHSAPERCAARVAIFPLGPRYEHAGINGCLQSEVGIKLFFFRCGNSSNNLLDVRPLIRLIISLGAMVGGQLAKICTWSLLTTSLIIRISKASHVSRTGNPTNSRIRSTTSPLNTLYRYFVTHTKWYSI